MEKIVKEIVKIIERLRINFYNKNYKVKKTIKIKYINERKIYAINECIKYDGKKVYCITLIKRYAGTDIIYVNSALENINFMFDTIIKHKNKDLGDI